MPTPVYGDGRFHFFTGTHMLLRSEPALVKQALLKIGIDLNSYCPKITGITGRPRDVGFDFFTNHPKALLKAVMENEHLKEDGRSTRGGRFSASNSKGRSFRQPGEGHVLHVIVSLTGRCNAHIDTHGYRDRTGYNLMRAIGHGYLDLGPDLAPGLYFAFGKTGFGGLMIAPMRGVDGEVRASFGISGSW